MKGLQWIALTVIGQFWVSMGRAGWQWLEIKRSCRYALPEELRAVLLADHEWDFFVSTELRSGESRGMVTTSGPFDSAFTLDPHESLDLLREVERSIATYDGAPQSYMSLYIVSSGLEAHSGDSHATLWFEPGASRVRYGLEPQGLYGWFEIDEALRARIRRLEARVSRRR